MGFSLPKSSSDRATVVVRDHCAAHGLFSRDPRVAYLNLNFKF
jgi:hypothetical protein